MKKNTAITKDIYWIGVNDYDTHLFEGIWPLPRGVCYNSYLIRDQKNAVIDTVKRGFAPQYIEHIKTLISPGTTLDYLVINHMEPDHSGAVTALIKEFPNLKIVCNARTTDFLQGFYGIKDNLLIMKDGQELCLGTHTLQFHLTPMVHWPETMMTFEKTSGTLFSMDAFGGFGTLDGGVCDDELDLKKYESEMLRYYSNIVAKYSPMVQRALKKLSGLEIKIIASTHGPVYRKNPAYVIDRYDRWSRQETTAGAVVAYSSMYGNTAAMAEEIARSLTENGIRDVVVHNLSKSHLSYVIRDVWKYRGLALGSSTYNLKLFPLMEMLVSKLKNDQLINRVTGVFGTFSWSGGAVKTLEDYVSNSKNLKIEPSVEARHAPGSNDLIRCRELGKNMAEKILNP